MKILITLISTLVFFSATVQAGDTRKNRKSKSQKVAPAPFIWGDPLADAPVELHSRVHTKLQVQVAPFDWVIQNFRHR